VTLNVARQPQVSYLSDLSPAEGSANEDAVDISGKSYPHSIYLSVVYDAGDVQYDLGRNYRRFRATIGLTDDSGSSASVLYEVFADGRRIYNATLGLGQTRDLDIDMTGVLRLDLRAKSTTEAPCCPAPDVNAAFGDARILAPAGTQLPSASPTP
jgi:hypothetical protein